MPDPSTPTATGDGAAAEILRQYLPQILDRLDAGASELLDAEAAARWAGVSKSKWFSMDAAGWVPAAVEMGETGVRRWNVIELRAWAAAGCPHRVQWAAIRPSSMRRVG